MITVIKHFISPSKGLTNYRVSGAFPRIIKTLSEMLATAS